MATHISLLAAPIYAALIQHAKVAQLESHEWRTDARAASIRQAKRLWRQTLDADPPNLTE